MTSSVGDDHRLEKELERALCLILKKGKEQQALLEKVRIDRATSGDVLSLKNLVGDVRFDVVQDNSDCWESA